MPSGKATATVNGRTIAETDNWEVVEGNIYVSTQPSNVWCLANSVVSTIVSYVNFGLDDEF